MYDNNNNDNNFGNSTGKIRPEDFKLNIPDEPYDDTSTGVFDNAGMTSGIDYTGRLKSTGRSSLYENDTKEKSEKKEHKKRDKIKAHKNKRVFRIVWLAMVVLVALTLASYLIGGSNDFFAIGRADGTATIEVPENVTLEQLTDILDKASVISKPEFFKIYCDITTDMQWFEPGRYEIKTNMDYEAIINFLQAGEANMEVVEITFQEGMTLQQMAAKLEENEVAKAEDVLAAAKTENFNNYDMINAITNTADKYYKLEGYLFPDTYQFYKGENVDSVLGKMLNDYQTRITSDIKDRIDKSGYTMDQVITIASIIQAEAASVDDMYNVSAVLHNRLERGGDRDIYVLGCDSTSFYPYKEGDAIPEGFTSSYDTYQIQGLPAGPICSPGLDAIKAALTPNPNSSDYFYFCHSADGTAYYASTEEGHQENLVAAGLV